jgi:hypothetical protein
MKIDWKSGKVLAGIGSILVVVLLAGFFIVKGGNSTHLGANGKSVAVNSMEYSAYVAANQLLLHNLASDSINPNSEGSLADSGVQGVSTSWKVSTTALGVLICIESTYNKESSTMGSSFLLPTSLHKGDQIYSSFGMDAVNCDAAPVMRSPKYIFSSLDIKAIYSSSGPATVLGKQVYSDYLQTGGILFDLKNQDKLSTGSVQDLVQGYGQFMLVAATGNSLKGGGYDAVWKSNSFTSSQGSIAIPSGFNFNFDGKTGRFCISSKNYLFSSISKKVVSGDCSKEDQAILVHAQSAVKADGGSLESVVAKLVKSWKPRVSDKGAFLQINNGGLIQLFVKNTVIHTPLVFTVKVRTLDPATATTVPGVVLNNHHWCFTINTKGAVATYTDAGVATAATGCSPDATPTK